MNVVENPIKLEFNRALNGSVLNDPELREIIVSFPEGQDPVFI